MPLLQQHLCRDVFPLLVVEADAILVETWHNLVHHDEHHIPWLEFDQALAGVT